MSAHWNVIGASVKGMSHEKNGAPCQDAHAHRILNDEVLVIAVADGAGSAAHADRGASLAVERSLETVERARTGALPDSPEAWQRLIFHAFEDARNALCARADEEGLPVRTLATTLTVVVATPTALITGQIGDGIVVADSEQDGLFAATQPQQGEYAGETYFLTMDDAMARVAGRVYDRGAQALSVMTDGLTRLALELPGHAPHAPFFNPLFSFSQEKNDPAEAHHQLRAFLSSARVNARTDDDKTLVLAARVGG